MQGGQFVQIYILSCPRGAEICLTMHQKGYHRSPGCTLEVINQGLNQRKQLNRERNWSIDHRERHCRQHGEYYCINLTFLRSLPVNYWFRTKRLYYQFFFATIPILVASQNRDRRHKSFAFLQHSLKTKPETRSANDFLITFYCFRLPSAICHRSFCGSRS